MICRCITESVERTKELGKIIGKLLPRGAVVILNGELGCGKTCLSKGIAEGLGIPEDEVSSPSFSIVHTYDSLVHIDLYRVEPEALHDIGFEEIIEDNEKVKVIEWMKSQELLKGLKLPIVAVNCSFLSENRREFEIDDGNGEICRKLESFGCEKLR